MGNEGQRNDGHLTSKFMTVCVFCFLNNLFFTSTKADDKLDSVTIKEVCLKVIAFDGDAQLAQLEEHETFDLGVVSLSPAVGVGIT